jgi:small subunit ribosomal protein S20
MANHENAKKAHRQNVKQASRNKSRMSMIRTMIKKVFTAISSGSRSDAETSLSIAQSEMMRGVKKNIIEKNTASRRISRLAHKIKAMDESKPAADVPKKPVAAKKAAPKKADKKEA